MDISIIISGNLTGFSRFYASPNANEIYNEAKFDFDFRNLVTFMKDPKEKVYAISFSPKVIAVSLITRILDSFRRPGILVVTALIPRYQLVCGTLDAHDKSAIYRLLNEINDKFYEKNFLNGVVNQNPSVLMQDYYSDILRNYSLVSDRMQKSINTTIEVNSLNKRIGYISTSEKDIPKYLSSLMRKSYNGYHHVFFADKAPTNIDEPAEEIISYKVRIENGNRPVPGEVRLTDRIPNISPEQGEKDIPNKNFTYAQVISGESGTDIIGTIENGETIVLNYRFPLEEKIVYFKFYDGANEVPAHIIRPVIVESNGASYPLSSNSWSFRGKEIYGHKNLKSGNSEYTIDNPSLDISRIRNDETINVYVHRGWNLEYYFGNSNKPKTVILTNRFSHQRKVFENITDTFVEHGLSGNQSDWDVEIQSDYYETIRVPATQRKFDINPKRTNHTNTSRQTDGGKNISSRQGEQHRTSTGAPVQGLKISSGDKHAAKDSEQIRREKFKRYITYCVAVLVACLFAFGGIWGYKTFFGEKKADKPDEDDIVFPVDLQVKNKDVTFKLIDSDGDELSQQIASQLSISINPEQILERIGDGLKYSIKYHPDTEESEKIKVDVKFKDINMLSSDYTPILEIVKINDVEKIRLSVKGSDIKLFDILSKKVAKKDYMSYSDRVQEVITRNYDYGMLLAQELEKSKPGEIGSIKNDARTTPPTTTTPPTIEETVDDGIVNKGFDDSGLTLDKLKDMGTSNKTEEARKQVLINVLGSITNGKCPKNADGLSRKQANTVSALIALNNKINALPEETDEQKALKKKLQTEFSNALLTNKNGKVSEKKNRNKELSIHTARAALKINIQ